MEKRPRILIVDDNRALVEMLTIFLEEHEFDVLGAYTGRDGIRQAQEERPDLILLDIHLPDVNGYDVARELRQMSRTQHIPIIFLTEARDRLSRLRGLRLGADDYIPKPFDLEELRLRIRNALSISQRVHQYETPTFLPSIVLLTRALDERIREKRPWALVGVFVRNFEAFRDHYGSIIADDALRAMGKLLQYIQHHLEGSDEDLVGHLDRHHFGILTEPHRLSAYRNAVRQVLIPKIPYFYTWEDREQLPEPHLMRVQVRTVTWKEGPFATAEDVLAALGIPSPATEDET